jgi:hypothetical protein
MPLASIRRRHIHRELHLDYRSKIYSLRLDAHDIGGLQDQDYRARGKDCQIANRESAV